MHIRRQLAASLVLFVLSLSPLGSLARNPERSNSKKPTPRYDEKFNDGLAPETIYTNPQVIAIPDDAYDGTLASMACTTINTTSVLPAGAVVSNVSISANISHTWIGDLTMKFRSPSGTVLTILNRPGSNVADDGTDAPVGDNSNWAGSTIDFGDGLGSEAETMGSTLADGQNICTDNGICAHDPSPDTAVTPPTAFNGLNDENAQGVWTLCVGDSALLDTGTLNSWSLNLTSASVVGASPNIAIPDDGYIGGFGGMGQACSTINTAGVLPAGSTANGIYLDVDINHTWVGDLTIKLRSPSNTIFTVLNRPGSNAADNGGGAVGNNANWNSIFIQFRDGIGPEAETMGNGLTTDQRICLDNGVCRHDPSPDTATQPPSAFSAFDGQTAIGNWTLCVGDSALADIGPLRAWRLTFPGALFAPTAANVSISGRVLTQLGSSISKARVRLADASGNERLVLTNGFGNYSFDDVAAGETYTVFVEAKGYAFEPRTVSVVDQVSNLDFVGQASFFLNEP
jgi:subtilisin-like proprotein convertase family protein